MKHFGAITRLVFALWLLIPNIRLYADDTNVVRMLMDVDFGDQPAPTPETGFAATGLTATDFWNYFTTDGGSRSSGVLENMEWTDGSVSEVGLTIANAGGSHGNGSPDSMYNGYLYSQNGGNIAVVLTNLPTGSYDFYLYGHGDQNDQSSVFQITSGSTGYGAGATASSGNAWLSPVWQSGQQYVVCQNVAVDSNQPVTITVLPDPAGLAIIAGMQMALVAPLPTNGPPVIAGSPSSQTVGAGTNVDFKASVGGSPSRVQWYLGSSLVPGATNAVLTLAASDATSGSYLAVFSNSYGMATTRVAVLTVIRRPKIVSSPESQTAKLGDAVTFMSSATGRPYKVQWYKGDMPIPGATDLVLTLTASLNSAGNYTIRISNSAGTATSAAAVLTVIAGSLPMEGVR